jgi:hypothetical protein
LLGFEKRVARRLAYNLAPPTYYDYAHRLALLWDSFTAEQSRFALPFGKCPQGVNIRLRRLYEQLDCIYMGTLLKDLVLKSLDYEVETLVINLFYLHTRTANVTTELMNPAALT